MHLRRLTDTGLAWFSNALASLREDPHSSIDSAVLEDPARTELLSPLCHMEPRTFRSKREAAEYLTTALAPLGLDTALKDAGLWGWLSIAYFDSVCPRISGRRKVHKDAHYIVNEAHGRIYRHLLRQPVRILRDMPRHNALLLETPLHIHGDIMEQLGGRLNLLRLPAVAEAAERMYFDPVKGKPKPNIVPKDARPGDLRNRLVSRINQLELTYDVGSLDGSELIALLGHEFSHWLS